MICGVLISNFSVGVIMTIIFITYTIFAESIPRATLLAPETNLATYAERIVEGCKYVHNSRSEEVEQILIKVKIAWNTTALCDL